MTYFISSSIGRVIQIVMDADFGTALERYVGSNDNNHLGLLQSCYLIPTRPSVSRSPGAYRLWSTLLKLEFK